MPFAASARRHKQFSFGDIWEISPRDLNQTSDLGESAQNAWLFVWRKDRKSGIGIGIQEPLSPLSAYRERTALRYAPSSAFDPHRICAQRRGESETYPQVPSSRASSWT